MVEAVNDPADRLLRGRRARGEVVGHYAWQQIGSKLAAIARDISTERPTAPDPIGLGS
jgi:hypothetical protein